MPQRAIDKEFLMPIEGHLSISGRGTVVTGRVEQGVVKVGEEVEIVGIRPTQKTVVTGVEMSRSCSTGSAGDNVGCCCGGRGMDDVERGQVGGEAEGRSRRTLKFNGRGVRFGRRRKAGVTRRFSPGIARSFTFGRRRDGIGDVACGRRDGDAGRHVALR